MHVDEVMERLRAVREPEIGAGIVDLGLVREVVAGPERVVVRIAMVSRRSPVPLITDAVECAVWRPGGPQVDVEVVWEPRWDPRHATPEALAALARPVFRDEVRNAPAPVSPARPEVP
ncbi:MAG: iron-sulfur cluster assembly protein [Thermoleophilia bacterium]